MNNIALSEVNKFNSSARDWWDYNGEYKTLHKINPLRANWIDQISPVAGCRVLDVGCGGGILSEALARRGGDVTGIDVATAALAAAKRHSLESGLKINYEFSTAENLASEYSGIFDIITCLEVLEHVPQPDLVVGACATLLKPGGSVYFSTINRNLKSALFAIFGAEYLLRLLPIGTHQHKNFIRPSELASWARGYELKIEDMTGLSFNPFTKNFRLESSQVDVNYMIHAKKLT